MIPCHHRKTTVHMQQSTCIEQASNIIKVDVAELRQMLDRKPNHPLGIDERVIYYKIR
jgi:hypothetical protein